jgi:hypothetical protein
MPAMSSVEDEPVIEELCEIPPTIPTLEEVIAAAESLAPDDRLKLIARLWETMPPEHWAAPSPHELIDIKRRLGDSCIRTPQTPRGYRERLWAFAAPGGPELYSAPRRFDLATIFVVTAAYSLLFTGLTLLDFHPSAMITIGGMITFVGVGQAVLVDLFNPRAGSIVAGVAFSMCASLFWGVYYDSPLWAFPMIAIFYGLIGGTIFGYLAGVLVGGVFLVADALRQKFAQARSVPLANDLDSD